MLPVYNIVQLDTLFSVYSIGSFVVYWKIMQLFFASCSSWETIQDHNCHTNKNHVMSQIIKVTAVFYHSRSHLTGYCLRKVMHINV